jgi:DNA repair photolyase
MIISASRRTDIPAFYTPWFMNRIREGFLLTRNPFNANQISRVSLDPNDVDVIVFWTRNPSMLMKHLSELSPYNYYFQYTITGYPKVLEKSVPRTHRAIKTFIELSDLIGADKIIWRYDPILLSNEVDINEHKRLFEKIACLLQGKTKRVVISFSDFYKKTEKNLKLIKGLIYSDITHEMDMLHELSIYLSTVAKKYGMEIESCAENIDISNCGITNGKCIDDGLIKNVFGISLSGKKDAGQREECGCIKSIDIGAYNTCMHGCSYCYATFNKTVVANNKAKHDPNSPFLIGGIDGIERNLLYPAEIQGKLL